MALGLPDRDGAWGDPTSAPPPWFGDPLPSQSPDVPVAPWGGHGAPARRSSGASARTDTVTRGSSSSDGPDAPWAEVRPPSAQGQKGSDPFPHHIPLSTAGSLLGARRSPGTGWKNQQEFRALAVSSAQSEFCPWLHLWEGTCPSAVLSLPTPISRPSTDPKGQNIHYSDVEGAEDGAGFAWTVTCCLPPPG